MFREKMAVVSEWMTRLDIPRDLKSKIRAYYAEVRTLTSIGQRGPLIRVKLPPLQPSLKFRVFG